MSIRAPVPALTLPAINLASLTPDLFENNDSVAPARSAEFSPRDVPVSSYRTGMPDGTPTSYAADPFSSFEYSLEPSSQSPTLAERVFGRQIAETEARLDLENLLLALRSRLHAEHRGALDAWHSDFRNQLNTARRPYQINGAQQAVQLERLLLQLEALQFREDLSYWSDCAEIRQRLAEALAAYRATKDRAAIVGFSFADG